MISHTGTIPLILLLAMTPVAAWANDSTYTDLDTDHCKTLSPEDVRRRRHFASMQGLPDYAVYFKEGDLRQSILYGPVSEAYIDGVFESFGPFNHAGRKIEWRLGADGKPIATILRWFIENIDPATGEPSPKVKGQVLVVSKVAGKTDGLRRRLCRCAGQPGTQQPCPAIADTEAETFACGPDNAAFHGNRGPTAAEPTRFSGVSMSLDRADEGQFDERWRLSPRYSRFS